MKVLCINGHPNDKSFNHSLQAAFVKSLASNGHQIEQLFLGELSFELSLKKGYSERTEWETDLVKAWNLIENADHIVWFYPVWWSAMPALMKGFIDRILIPGKAFKYRENSPMWDKLLLGKTSEIVCTLDYPPFYYKWFLGSPATKVFEKRILNFVGIKNKRTTLLGPVRNSTLEKRNRWIQKVEKLGASIR